MNFDGRYLGSLKEENILREGEVRIDKKYSFFEIKVDGEQEVMIVRNIKSFLPAILDEIKPLFFLPKIGTHTFHFKGKLMLGYKTQLITGNPYPDLTLDYSSFIPRTREFTYQVKRTFAFREAFGITKTYEKSIILRFEKNIPQVLSFNEPGSVVFQDDPLKSVIPQTVLTEWFNDDLDRYIKDLFCFNRELPEASINYYRSKIEKIVLRIDKNLITCVDGFLERLYQFI